MYARHNLFSFHLSFQLTGTAARRGRGIHAGIFQYLDKLATECTDVLFDLVHVVFRDALTFRFALLDSDVSSYQISHDTLISKVPLGSLFDLSLRQESEIETLQFQKFSLQSTRYGTLYIVHALDLLNHYITDSCTRFSLSKNIVATIFNLEYHVSENY